MLIEDLDNIDFTFSISILLIIIYFYVIYFIDCNIFVAHNLLICFFGIPSSDESKVLKCFLLDFMVLFLMLISSAINKTGSEFPIFLYFYLNLI